MKHVFRLFCLLLPLLPASRARGQTIVQRDPEIADLVAQVNRDSLERYVRDMVAFGTRNTLSTQRDPKFGIGAARTWVLGKFRQFSQRTGGRLQARLDTFHLAPDGRRVNRPLILGNVVATLPGTDPQDKRLFLVSGHLDNMRTSVMDSTGIAPGANDDASGVAAVLECARLLSQRKFPATVVFVAFSGEEQGLLGAYAMARRAKRDGLVIEAVLNNDIMGSNHSNETNIVDNTRIRVFSEGLPLSDLSEARARTIRQLGLENDGPARQLARYCKEVGERYVPHLNVTLIYRNDRFLRGGDHTAFVENGFPAIRFCEMNENFTHQHQDVRVENGIQYGDLPEFMDFEYLRKNTALNLSVLANLAKAPAMPQQVTIEVRKLTNYTELSWQAPATGAVSGYYVLIRETSNSVWQQKVFVKETTTRLPYSKDNYFFAVQAVTATGNESLPVVPSVAGR